MGGVGGWDEGGAVDGWQGVTLLNKVVYFFFENSKKFKKCKRGVNDAVIRPLGTPVGVMRWQCFQAMKITLNCNK